LLHVVNKYVASPCSYTLGIRSPDLGGTAHSTPPHSDRPYHSPTPPLPHPYAHATRRVASACCMRSLTRDALPPSASDVHRAAIASPAPQCPKQRPPQVPRSVCPAPHQRMPPYSALQRRDWRRRRPESRAPWQGPECRGSDPALQPAAPGSWPCPECPTLP